MNKQQIKKNRLDLEYQKNIQILNAIFIFLTTGVLGFIGSFIFLEESNKLLLGLIVSALILTFGIVLYRKVNKKLDSISKDIENI